LFLARFIRRASAPARITDSILVYVRKTPSFHGCSDLFARILPQSGATSCSGDLFARSFGLLEPSVHATTRSKIGQPSTGVFRCDDVFYFESVEFFARLSLSENLRYGT
jgi:hypothetical protein